MPSQKFKICVLCGARPATTKDHVPPKGLFKGIIVDRITVPACAECNNGAASDDEDFRYYVSAQVGKQTPASAALWDEGAHKSIKLKRKLRSTVLASTREVNVIGPDGEKTTRLAFEVDARIYQSVLERTTRGLYFHHTGVILPPTTPIAVAPLSGIPDVGREDFQKLNVASIGGDAFIYRFGVDPIAPENSIWLFAFHQSLWILVNTGQLAIETGA